jgi:hypothetical protein
MARIQYAKINALDLAGRKEYPMTIELGLTDELCNTQYAPLAALCAHYQQHQVLAGLEEVQIG